MIIIHCLKLHKQVDMDTYYAVREAICEKAPLIHSVGLLPFLQSELGFS